jgi:hypothetical protein
LRLSRPPRSTAPAPRRSPSVEGGAIPLSHGRGRAT